MKAIPAAKRLIRILNNLNAYLSASQLGITLASLALGWVGEPFVAQVFAQPLEMLPETARHAAAFLIAFALISSLSYRFRRTGAKTYRLRDG